MDRQVSCQVQLPGCGCSFLHTLFPFLGSGKPGFIPFTTHLPLDPFGWDLRQLLKLLLILINRKHSCFLDPHKSGSPGSVRREVPIPLWPYRLSWGISFGVPSGIEIQATLESLEYLSNLPRPFPISAHWFSASGIGLPRKCAFLDPYHILSRYHFVSLTSL